MSIVDLFPDLEAIVAESDSEIAFRARFWSWLAGQREGPLGPLLSDMLRLWSGRVRELSLEEAQNTVRRLAGRDFPARAARVVERLEEVVGRAPEADVVLLAGLRRPEGYSRFDRGRNTVFIGLDHPSSLRHEDHFEIVLAHELTHAVRDPSPAVLADYGGAPGMSHDDFVERHPFREHLVSEALATALSERAYPGQGERRYVYFEAEDYAWCEGHRRVIADRMLRALEDGEDYHTFYAEGSVVPGSPDCCDYYFGFHLGRHALQRHAAGDLLVQPATEMLERHLTDFLDRFLEEERAGRSTVTVRTGPTEAPELTILPPPVQRFYRDWMAEVGARPSGAAAAEQELARAVAGARLEHMGRVHEVYGFPIALAAEEAGYIRWVVESLMRTVEKVVASYRMDPAVRGFFDLPAPFEALVAGERAATPSVPLARFDAYWNGRRIRFLELNTNGTAGIQLADRVGALWLAAGPIRAFAEGHRLAAEPIVQRLVETIEAAWRRGRPRGARRPRPRLVALVDWAGVPTRAEHEQIGEALGAAGLETLLADPSDLAYDGKELRAAGRPVDLVYRRLTLGDVLAHAARLAPLLEAARDGRVVTVGPFGADVAHTKRLFAFLTHESCRTRFSMEERALIDAHVPWTRILRPGRTLRGGELRELREIAVREREQFVLKPAEGHEGRDVLLGLEASAVEWERELDRRMDQGHVLQQYVAAPVRTVFLPRAGGLEPTPLYFHLGEFVFDGKLAGFLARASSERVLSADSQERALPVFVLEDEAGARGADELSRP